MAIVNLKTILPNDNQITITDKINFNFDQILTCGGGPIGDPGPIGGDGGPGGQGIRGFTGNDGADGTTWYVGFGTPPPQPSPDIYKLGDLFLSTSDNFIWEFDGAFWVKTTNQLKVAGGEFKSDSTTNTGVILQDITKNLIISTIDYDGGSLDPNSSSFNSKLKIVSTPGVFIELGLDLAGSENQTTHATIELDGLNNVNINNNGGGFLISGISDIILSNSTKISFNSLIDINQADGQYVGTIINPNDLVNKAYVDAAELNAQVDGEGLSGNVWNVVRIGASPNFKAEASSVMEVRNNIVTVQPTGAITDLKLSVTGELYCEGFRGGAWDHVETENYVKVGDKLEIWGILTKIITNNNDILVTITYPINFGVNNTPIINITPSVLDTPGATDDNIAWGVKHLNATASSTTFKLFSIKRALGLEGEVSFPIIAVIQIHWHAVGGWKDRSTVPSGGVGDQGSGGFPFIPGP